MGYGTATADAGLAVTFAVGGKGAVCAVCFGMSASGERSRQTSSTQTSGFPGAVIFCPADFR